MGVNWLVSLCVSLTILALWAVCQKLQRSWIGPGGIMCGVWFFGTLLPLFFAADFPIYASAYLLVLSFVVVSVVFTSLPIALLSPQGRDGEDPPANESPARRCLGSDAEQRFLHRVYWAALAIGSVTPVMVFKLAVTQFGTTNLLELAAKVTVARYTGEFKQTMVVSILTMFLLLATLLGGLLMGLSNKRPKQSLKYLAWILPLLLVTVIQTTKASCLYGALLFGGSLITGLVARGGEKTIRIGKLLGSLTAMCVLGFGFMFVGLVERYANSGKDAMESVPMATIYCVGHMAVLGTWTEDGGIGRADCAAGSYTFGGLYEILGGHVRAAGVFDDMITFPGGGTSNIYTAFRACIDDFTLPGALLFFAILSFIGGMGWVGVVRGKREAVVPIAAYFAYVLWSPIASIFVYNTIIGALSLLGLVMLGTGFVALCSNPRMRIIHDAA